MHMHMPAQHGVHSRGPDRMQTPVAGIYPLVSGINHSCRPNAAYHFRKGGRVVVRTLTQVQKGDELTIAYLDCMLQLPR